MSSIELAVARFQEGFNCAQSVFTPLAEQLGLPLEFALKVSAPFGGGMGRTGQTCGVVTGAYMALGLKFGYIKAEDRQAKDELYRLVREFNQRFQARHGSLLCRELLGWDLSKPEEAQQASQTGAFRSRCPWLVRTSAEILVEMLELTLPS